jgi:uncharacterized membrane protein (UPF0127 family)
VAYRVAVRALAVLGVAVSIAAFAATASATTSATTTLRLDGLTLRPELALTTAQRGRGLMFRKRAPVDGMLFVFRTATSGGFWMKNTLVPLKIVFFDSAGRQVRTMRMTPCAKDPCRIYDPAKQYRFALELPASDRRPALRLRPLAALKRLVAASS